MRLALTLDRFGGLPIDLDPIKTLGKTAYKARVRKVVRSKKGQWVGAAQAMLMRRVCQEVVRKNGAATGY